MLARSLIHLARQHVVRQQQTRAAISTMIQQRHAQLDNSSSSFANDAPATSEWSGDGSNDDLRADASSRHQRTSPSSSSLKVTSLQQFFEEVRRLRRELGHASNRDRAMLRGELATFWTSNVDIAAALCQNARDIGFLAFYGTSDSQCGMSPTLIPPLFRILVRDKDTCNAMDMTASLRFLSREICRLYTARESTSDERTVVDSELNQLFVEFGMERLRFLFGLPDEGDASQNHRVIGKGDDAINGLEFILSVGNGIPGASRLTAHLLNIAAQDDLRMTSIIACFGILRVSMPKLNPHDAADICTQLLRRVKKRDAKLINPYHFVKIIMCMSRIDKAYLTHPNLWSYVVAKACIFVCNASKEHRRLIVMSMRSMLHDRQMDNLMSDIGAEIQAQFPLEYEELIVRPIVHLKVDSGSGG